jgi:hypothetical protein
MLATVHATVLAVRERTDNANKVWCTVYLLQEGRQDPVQAYYAKADLQGAEPKAGDTITAEVLAYGGRNGAMAVRLDVCEVVTAHAVRPVAVPA